MNRTEDKNTRYYLDLDLRSGTIVGWGYDQRTTLAKATLKEPSHHRIYLSKGQYNKFEKKAVEQQCPTSSDKTK